MADHGGNFNSSDIELEEIEDPFAKLGAKSIDFIIESAFADRIASKRSSKLLKYTKGAPGTVHTNATWMNRFVAFQINTLKVDPTIPPTGRHLERFFSIVPSKVQTYSSHGVPSFSWIKHGVSSLMGGLIFKHETFKLSSHERMRLSTTIDKLLKDGDVTPEPTRVAQWVTAALVIRLGDSYLLDALNNGTKSWSITLSRLLSMVLMAACASRTGEIGRSSKYVNMECLCFKDVDIRFDEHGDIIAHIVLRFQKKERHKQTMDRRTVEVRNLKDPKHNPVCPIKLLLIYGVRRQAMLYGGDMDSVLEQGRSRGTIVWKPELLELPVICAIDGPGKGLLYDKPAAAYQILQTVKKAGLYAGIITPIVAHDIRRGSAKDFITLPGAAKGVATAKTAVQIGHSAMSSTKGLTQRYAGDLDEDHWGPRLAASKTYLFGPQLADRPIKIARLRTDDVVSECEKLGVDPNDVNARATIRRQMKHERLLGAKEALDPLPLNSRVPLSKKPPNILPLGNSKRPRPSHPDTATIDPRLLGDALPHIQTGGPYLDSVQMHQGDDQDDGHGDEGDNAAEGLRDILGGSHSTTMTNNFLDRLHVPTDFDSDVSKIHGPAIDFMRYFSTLDVAMVAVLEEGQTRFEHACKNATYGCLYKNRYAKEIATHEPKCKYNAGYQLDERPYICTRCQSTFKHKDDLTAHVKRIHNWEPKECPKCPEGGPTYALKSELRKHHESVHAPGSRFVPQRCNFEGCTSQHIFQTERTFKKHLDGIHHLVGKELAIHIERARAPE